MGGKGVEGGGGGERRIKVGEVRVGERRIELGGGKLFGDCNGQPPRSRGGGW